MSMILIDEKTHIEILKDNNPEMILMHLLLLKLGLVKVIKDGGEATT